MAVLRHFETLADLAACVGQPVFESDWVEVTQARIDGFAQATGDHQWIHVDVQRARQGPFGAPIAHGFLTLSLLPVFLAQLAVREAPLTVNYGLNRLRFMAPVPVGSRLRGHFTLVAAESLAPTVLQATWAVRVACDECDKPACVAEWLVRYQA